MKYRATATVIDQQWRVTVPEIERDAETGYLLRIEFEARMMIADHFGVDPDSFEVTVSYESPPPQWTDPDGLEYTLAARGGSGGMTKFYVPTSPR
jgi:hypothetical protein